MAGAAVQARSPGASGTWRSEPERTPWTCSSPAAARADAVARDIGAAGLAIGDVGTGEGAAAIHADAVAGLGGPIELLVDNADTSPIEREIADHVSNAMANGLSSDRCAARG